MVLPLLGLFGVVLPLLGLFGVLGSPLLGLVDADIFSSGLIAVVRCVICSVFLGSFPPLLF